MSELTRLAALARKDARGVARDRFLLWMALYPLVLTVVLRVAVPWIPIDGAALYAAPWTVVLAPSLMGMLLGFALIEEHEQKTWALLQVLPLPAQTLWMYLVGGSFLAGLALSLVCVGVYGRMPALPGAFLASSAAAALTAPALALLMGALARDKIQGLALGKILSASSAAPMVALFLAPEWHPLLYWSPWYWIYFGLLQAFAAPGELAALGRPILPGLPAWTFIWVPLAECALLIAAAMRALARRVS